MTNIPSIGFDIPTPGNEEMVSRRWAERERLKMFILGHLSAQSDAAVASVLHWIQGFIKVGPDGRIPWMDETTWCIMDSITRAAWERFDRMPPESPSDLDNEELALATHFALRTEYVNHENDVKEWILLRGKQLMESLDAKMAQLDAMSKGA